ncbi:MAG: hypothetical protein LDL24_01540 [Treponema sp.]|nr:hypothetical protein [Treponema sp.]
MVYNSTIITSIPDYSLARSSLSGSRIALPVSRSSYIYSHFKHVSGIPAEEGQPGVPITKLKILDALIDQLSQMKRDVQSPVSVDHIDTLIDQYKKEIEAAQAANKALPYNPPPPVSTGLIVNLVA